MDVQQVGEIELNTYNGDTLDIEKVRHTGMADNAFGSYASRGVSVTVNWMATYETGPAYTELLYLGNLSTHYGILGAGKVSIFPPSDSFLFKRYLCSGPQKQQQPPQCVDEEASEHMSEEDQAGGVWVQGPYEPFDLSGGQLWPTDLSSLISLCVSLCLPFSLGGSFLHCTASLHCTPRAANIIESEPVCCCQ